MHALIAIFHTWMTTLDLRGSVHCVFVDFRKAFDLVDHNILFTNTTYLIFYCSGVPLIYLTANSMSGSTVQCLCSKTSGAIPQGSWLGPLAFLVRIDDLSAGCPLHKYVDGTTLSELVQPKQLDTHILTYLADLFTWAAHSGMEINTSKTKKWYLVIWLTYPCLILHRKLLKELLHYIQVAWCTH